MSIRLFELVILYERLAERPGLSGLNNRTLIEISGLVLLGLLVLGLSPLLHSFSGPNLSASATSSVTMTTLTVSGLGPITGFEVQYSGVFYTGVVAAGCSTEPHQCLLPEMEFFFLATTNSSAYRLIPMANPPLFPDGTRVKVTGVLVTPSSLGSMIWQGYRITGDIYVQSTSTT